MRFKEWLLQEDQLLEYGQEKGVSKHGNSWDLIYPSSAADFPYDFKNPKTFWYLQWRWQRGMEIGRPLYNIDKDLFNWKYVAPYSTTLPDDNWWIHKEDNKKSSIGIKRGIDLVRMGVGKSYDKPLILHGPMVNSTFGENPSPPPHSALRWGKYE